MKTFINEHKIHVAQSGQSERRAGNFIRSHRISMPRHSHLNHLQIPKIYDENKALATRIK